MSETPSDPTTSARAGIGAKRHRAPGAGRPRKSAALHLLEGTRSRAPKPGRNKQAQAPAPVDVALLTPPRTLPKRARDFWKLNAPGRVKCGRLNQQFLSAWTMLCTKYAQWELAAYRLHRMPLSHDLRPALVTEEAKAFDAVCKLGSRFALDYLSDIRLSAIDGSDAGEGLPATSGASAPAAAAGDRSTDWMRTYGASSQGA